MWQAQSHPDRALQTPASGPRRGPRGLGGARAPAARIPSPDLGAPGGLKSPEWMNSQKIWIHSLPFWSVVSAQLPFSYQEAEFFSGLLVVVTGGSEDSE